MCIQGKTPGKPYDMQSTVLHKRKNEGESIILKKNVLLQNDLGLWFVQSLKKKKKRSYIDKRMKKKIL